MISIIIPIYNMKQYINKCIESVINQSFSNIEIILIDDGSTDGSAEICDYWATNDSRIRTYHKENGGLSSARNYGITMARGEFVGFVDADDWISPIMYEKLYSMIQMGDYDIASCGWERCLDNGDIVEKSHYEDGDIDYKNFIKELLKVGTQHSDQYAWNKLYRKEVLSDETYPCGLTDEDVEGTMRCVMKSQKKIVRTKDILYFYRCNDNSITNSGFNDCKFDYLTIADHIKDISYSIGDDDIIKWAKYFRYRAAFGVLSRLVALDQDGNAYSKYEARIKELLVEIKKHYFELLTFNWPISRKLILTMYCINYKYSYLVINKLIKRKRKK